VKPPFVRRVALRNYKSIASCNVELLPLTFLVGANGSGKSNFLDALRFVADALRTTLDHAIRDRGGVNQVRRRSAGHPTNFEIAIDFTLPSGDAGHYSFRVAAQPRGAYEVQAEECWVKTLAVPSKESRFSVRDGQVTGLTSPAPLVARDRLYLVSASGLPEFKPVFESLSHMGFYNLNPDQIRDLQQPDAGELLARDGSNLCSVLDRLATDDPGTKQRIETYLGAVVPGLQGVDVKNVGPKESLEFRQRVAGSPSPWRFPTANMSDGTLRALGILVALFQRGGSADTRVPFVGIEEPEVALHPAAAGVLLDALRDASQETQVIVTSHSPDLLDDDEIESSSILAVISEDGVTKIGPLDEAVRSALADHLYTAGELLRLNQLSPDPVGPTKFQSVQPALPNGIGGS
jgi:predicted ATPase